MIESDLIDGDLHDFMDTSLGASYLLSDPQRSVAFERIWSTSVNCPRYD